MPGGVAGWRRVAVMWRVPVETSGEQREALVRAFAEKFTHGIGSYVAAIHDQQGNDISNPHFHLVAFDVMQKSGGRGRPRSTLGMARKNAIENTAKAWADLHNAMMKKWGFGAEFMISHLSLFERGIDRIPTIHEGASARAMAHAGKEPVRKPEWRGIDEGHSRAEANKVIHEINEAKEKINEREYRLGRNDEQNGKKRDQCRAESRESRGWSGEGSGNTAPPFATTGGIETETGRAGKPSKRPPFTNYAADRQRPGRSGNQFPLSRLGRRRRARGRHRVRRIFRELIWLRDTLWARLLPDERQSHSNPEPALMLNRSSPERSGESQENYQAGTEPLPYRKFDQDTR